MKYVMLIVALLLIPVVALAADGETANNLLQNVVDAFKAGKYGVGIGFILLALTQLVKFIATKVGKDIPAGWQPWIAAILGVVAAVGLSLAAGVVWWSAMLGGLCFGATAGGLWSLVAKHFGKLKAK